MKTAYHISRIVFGLWYVFSGVEFFLPFNLQPLGNTPLGQEFTLALIHSGLFTWVKIAEMLIGLACLSDRCMPLAMAMAVPLTIVIAYWNFVLEWRLIEAIVGTLTAAMNLIMRWPHRAYYWPTLKAVKAEKDFGVRL